jgi:thiol-disulfide isomerase/thioredoxin
MSKKYNLEKPIFVLFYAKWCGFCKSFMPIWEQLEKEYNCDDINIIKFENDESFTKKIKIYSFPTLYYIYKDKFIEYNSSRELDDVKTFINEQLKKIEK